MSHELSFYTDADGQKKAEMTYTGATPWHKFGTACNNLMTAEEVLKNAHLDWLVGKIPLYSSDGRMAKGINAIERRDTGAFLGYVGDQYIPFQNIDAFNFFDNIVSRDEAVYETAGALFGGSKVWIMARLPDYLRVGDDDKILKYLLLSTSHDGTARIRGKVTPTRVVCWNTMQITMRGAGESVSIHHKGDVNAKVSAAGKMLSIANKLYEDLGKIFNQMAMKKVAIDQSFQYFERLFPVFVNSQGVSNLESRNEIIEQVVNLRESGKGTEMARGTLWGDYQAVVEYVDYYKPFRKEHTQLNNILFDSKLKNEAYQLAVDLLN